MRNNNFKAQIKTVWKFAKNYKLFFILAEICILVSYAVSLLLPLNLAYFIDNVFYKSQYDKLGRILITYAVLFTLSALFNMIYAYIFQTLINRFVVDVKNELFKKVIHARPEFLGSMNTGDVMSRIDNDASQFIFIVQRNLFHFVNSILMCIGIIVLTAYQNFTIAVLVTAAAVVPIIITHLYSKLKQRVFSEKRSLEGDYDGRLFEILKGMRDIRLCGAFKWAESKILKPLKKLIKIDNKLRRIDFEASKIIGAVNLLSTLIIYIYSVKLVTGFEMTIGVFLAVIEYVALLHWKMDWILTIYLDWAGRKTSIDRINEILNVRTEDENGIDIENDIERVEFKNVFFKYKENEVLKNISFDIKKGEKTAVIGESGVGKTTVAGLLTKLREPDRGEILINGQNLKGIKYSSLREKIGVVSQEVVLFNESIRFNLTLGREGYADSELIEALNKAGLYDVGLDRRGDSLSGGQKQRVMIARILLRKVKFIIFDEATSALDRETEDYIAERIKSMGRDMTMIIISHRLNTIRDCDRVIVLEGSPKDRRSFGEEEQTRSGELLATKLPRAVRGGICDEGMVENVQICN